MPDAAIHPDPVAAAPDQRVGRTRGAISVALLVVAALLTPLTVVAAWARAQIESTDRYVATVAPLADDPAVQEYVAQAAADAIYELLEVDELVGALPAELAAVGVALGPAVRGFLVDAASRFTASPAFSQLWREANRAAHTVIRGVLTGESEVADLRGGQLTLDLGALLRVFQTDLVDAGFTLAERLDLTDVDRTVVLVEGAQLESIATARELVGGLESLSWLLFLATIAAAVGSVLVAPDRRRGTTRLGVGLALSMVLVAVGLSIARRAFLGAIVGGLPRPVASSFFDAVSGSMRVGFRGAFVLGLVIAALVLVASRDDFADRWARPTQVAVTALGVLTILARDQAEGGFLGFVAMSTIVTVAVLEVVRRRWLLAVNPVGPRAGSDSGAGRVQSDVDPASSSR
jgi:hypothetical protein